MNFRSDFVKELVMEPRRTIPVLAAASMCLWSAPSHAKWTKWYHVNKEWQALTGLLDKYNYLTWAKRVQCKADNKGLWIRVDKRPSYSAGVYHLQVDTRRKLDGELQRQIKSGVTVISRSDVKTTPDVMSCVIWRHPA